MAASSAGLTAEETFNGPSTAKPKFWFHVKFDSTSAIQSLNATKPTHKPIKLLKNPTRVAKRLGNK